MVTLTKTLTMTKTKTNMKRFILFLLILVTAIVVLTGCRTKHDVVVERLVERDTVFQERVLVDSVFVGHEVLMDRSRDTLLIREKNVEIRYRLLHDSIYIARVDSIPYEVRITKREEIPKWKKWLNWIGYASLLFCIFVIWRRLTS